MKIKHFLQKIAILGILSLLVSGFAALMPMDVSADNKVTIEGQGYIGGEPDNSTSPLPPKSGGSQSGSSSAPSTGDNHSPVILLLVCAGSLLILLITTITRYIGRRKRTI